MGTHWPPAGSLRWPPTQGRRVEAPAGSGAVCRSRPVRLLPRLLPQRALTRVSTESHDFESSRASRVHPADRWGRGGPPPSTRAAIPAVTSVRDRRGSLGQDSGRRGREFKSPHPTRCRVTGPLRRFRRGPVDHRRRLRPAFSRRREAPSGMVSPRVSARRGKAGRRRRRAPRGARARHRRRAGCRRRRCAVARRAGR
jgi:hypothetical protein